MKRGASGDLAAGASIGGEVVRAFVSHPLPPEPALEVSEGLREEMNQALLSLGRLDSISSLLPDTALFLYMYVRKEAVLSSQIEGTQSSLSDLLLFELDDAPGVPLDDVLEVSSYVKALELGVRRIREGMPLTGRLFREVHGILLSGARGAEKSPGEYRRTLNWIGGSRPGSAQFVPPPPDQVLECMAELEKFIHDVPERAPTLEKIALAHVQFETVHPFLDGNGRLGRLLITLMLVGMWGDLGERYRSGHLRWPRSLLPRTVTTAQSAASRADSLFPRRNLVTDRQTVTSCLMLPRARRSEVVTSAAG